MAYLCFDSVEIISKVCFLRTIFDIEVGKGLLYKMVRITFSFWLTASVRKWCVPGYTYSLCCVGWQ